jgi:hypothetical protein
MSAPMPLSTRIAAAVALSAALLASCSAEEGGLRPGNQELDKLIMPEAQRRALATAAPTVNQARQASSMCGEVLRISERGQLVLDRSAAGRLVVDPSLWERVPAEAQQAILRCDQASRSNPDQPIVVAFGSPPE